MNSMFDHIVTVTLKIIGAENVKKILKEVETKINDFGKGTQGAAAVERTMEKAGAAGKKAGKDIEKGGKQAASGIGLFTQAMGRALIVAPAWMLVRNIMMGVFSTIQNQTKFLIELETAMARIQMVGKGTAEEFKGLQDRILSMSFAYGIAASEAISAAQIFAQQGKSVAETIVLTEQAMLAAQVLGTDVKTTVEDLTAALNGFRIPMRDSVSVIDKWVKVEKEFAVTAKDLAEATKTTGATANQLGITIEQFLGDVTAVIEVTRKSGSEAARGIGFMYARLLTNAKPVIEKLANVQFYMDEQGKSSSKLTDALRPVSDIIGELAGKWDTLSTAEKLSIAEALGSKRQMTVVNALMQNYNRSIEARIAALTSAGAAEQNFIKLQDTSAYKFKQVETAWNNVTMAFADTGAIKGATDVLKNFLINLTYLIDEEKGLRLAFAETNLKESLTLQKEANQIKTLQDVLELRQKIAKQPITPQGTESLNTLDAYIKQVTKTNPTIKIALETRDEGKIKEEIEKLDKEFVIKINEKQIIDEFSAPLAVAEDKFAQLQKILGGGKPFAWETKRLKDAEKAVTDLYAKRAEKMKKTNEEKLIEFELTKGAIDYQDEADIIAGRLTRSEEARFEIEQKMLDFEKNSNSTKLQQLEYEKELIKLADELYDKHAKTVELSKIDTKIAQEKTKIKEQERNQLEALAIQYASASDKERRDIRRLMELQQMSAESVAAMFSGGDEDLILKNISQFTDEVKQRIAYLIAAQEGLPGVSQLGPTQPPQPGKGYSDFATKPNINNISQLQGTNNEFNIPIIMQGAITDNDIKALLDAIDKKVKAQPNYISNENISKFLDAIKASEELSKKNADTVRNKI